MSWQEWENTYLRLEWLVANPRKFQKILKEWDLDKSAKILDLCCGNGGCFNVFLKEDYAFLCGLDISRHLLANVRVPVPLIQGDVYACPIKTNAIDVVFINKALHHFLDHTCILSEIKRIVKPQGYFCLIEPRRTWFRDLYHVVCLSPLADIFPFFRSLKRAVLEEGDTYFPWLENAEKFMKILRNDFDFTILSNDRDLRDYIVKCRNNK